MLNQQTTKSAGLMLATALLIGSVSAKADFAFSHNGHTYQVITSAKPWQAALTDATTKSIDGASCYLARIDDSAENNAIFSQLSSNIPASDFGSTSSLDGGDAAYVWIGANDRRVEGTWIWEDNQAQFWSGNFTGSPVGGLYNNWGAEPDNFEGQQNAAAIGLTEWPLGDGFLGSAGEWNDVKDSNNLYYIVECDVSGSGPTLTLGEPINGEIHSGIGNLRGWAIAENGIDRVEIFIDGTYMYDAPYGGLRVDVEAAFPNVDGSLLSGYSLAFGYADLGAGQHTVRAVAYDLLGNSTEQLSTFKVVAYDKNFINSNEVVDLSGATCNLLGDEIKIRGASIGQQGYNLKLKWRTAEQGFEVIEIQY